MWACSVWLADAGTQRGFTARLADYGAHRPHTTTDENFVARKRTSHAAPELLEEAGPPSYFHHLKTAV